MRGFHLRIHLHSAAAVIAAFCVAVALRPTGGYATATANAGSEAPCCAEDRIA